MSIKLGSLEILRDASIKGDTIYFPHDGPKEAWLRGADYRVLFVGADDKHDKLAQWLLKRNDIQVCPHRCHNYLALYAAIDRAMGNPKVTDARLHSTRCGASSVRHWCGTGRRCAPHNHRACASRRGHRPGKCR